MVILFIMLIGGMLSAAIASSKGRSGLGWFVIGALFPLPAVIIACVMKAQPPLEVPPDLQL